MSEQTVPVQETRKEDRIPLAGSIFEIAGLIFLLVLFNQYPEWIRFWVSFNDLKAWVPLLEPSFFGYLPLLNLLWGLSLATAVVKAVYQRWTPSLRAVDLCLSVFSIYVLWQIVSGGPILNTNAVPDFVNMLFKFGLGVVMVITAVSLIPKLRDLMRSI